MKFLDHAEEGVNAGLAQSYPTDISSDALHFLFRLTAGDEAEDQRVGHYVWN
jgi:hypothetical protein